MLALRQFENHLHLEFTKFVVLSEAEAKKPQHDKEMLFKTRALVGFYLKNISGCSDEKIAKHIVDGYQDNGIDGIYYDPLEKMLHIIQTKWINRGNSGVVVGDVHKFISGTRDILTPKFDKFNEEIKALNGEINAALLDANTRVTISIIATTQQNISQEAQQVIDSFLNEQNTVHEFMAFEYYGIKRLHDFLIQGTIDNPIDTEILLINWGEIQEPVKAISGMVSGNDLAACFEEYGKRLFSPNIRYFLGRTEVNDSIGLTAKNKPKLFWYYNNGVTAISRSIKKKPVGGSSHATGIFECEGFFIVNGAQTVGTLYETRKRGTEISDVLVNIRIIEVTDENNEFGLNVTRNTNTQNRVDSRDFVSLDKVQERIYEEMILENIIYAFKSGDVVPDGMDGFTFEEAAISQACFNEDVSLTVLAKSGVSKLWANTDKTPYKILFNSSTEGPKLWRIVQIMKKVEAWINSAARNADNSRDRLTIVHGNRFILMLAYNHLREIGAPDTIAFTDDQIEAACTKSYVGLKLIIQSVYPEAQLGTLFKNPSKCADIKTKLI